MTFKKVQVFAFLVVRGEKEEKEEIIKALENQIFCFKS